MVSSRDPQTFNDAVDGAFYIDAFSGRYRLGQQMRLGTTRRLQQPDQHEERHHVKALCDRLETEPMKKEMENMKKQRKN